MVAQMVVISVEMMAATRVASTAAMLVLKMVDERVETRDEW